MEKPQIIKSKRRTISLHVNDEAQVIVKVPYHVCMGEVSSLLLKHNDWIIKKQRKAMEKISKLNTFEFDETKIYLYKKQAKEMLKQKADQLSTKLNLPYKKLRLSGAGKRWGSCSASKTINLNWRLLFVPEKVIDYVVLHEFTHLKHMDHSAKFWEEVKKHEPDFKKYSKWLSDNDFILKLGS